MKSGARRDDLEMYLVYLIINRYPRYTEGYVDILHTRSLFSVGLMSDGRDKFCTL